MSKRERESGQYIDCARLHSIVHSSFGNVVVVKSFMKEWRDWCTIVYNWEGEWTTFCSNNYCTQLSLVLIAHNQSVQDSETWKCTVPVFVQFKYTQGKYLKRQTLHRCAVKKSGWDRSDINIRERQEMQSRNYRQGFFVRPPFTHHQLKLNSFQDYTFFSSFAI